MIEATGDIEGTMRLPAVLDLAAAEGFLATLLQRIQADKALRLDASGVETLTLSCMQIILSAVRNYDVTLAAPSDAVISAFKDIGLDCPQGPELGLAQELKPALKPAQRPEQKAEPEQMDAQIEAPTEGQAQVQVEVQVQIEDAVEDQAPDQVQVLDQAAALSPGQDEDQGQAQTPTDEASMTKRILTIDDSRTIRDMLMLTLTDAGYDVVLAEATGGLGGRVALESRLPGLSAWIRVLDYRKSQLERLGNVEQATTKLRELESIGVDHYSIYLMTHGQEETLAAYGEHIIPQFAGAPA
jgi:anti-anti-sigma regulatory factor